MTSTRLSTLELLASKDGLRDGRLFVGRRRQLSLCAGLGTTASAIWIWGPRRIGKTSLADELERQFAARFPEGRRARVDASTLHDIDDLLGAIVAQCASGSSARADSDQRARFQRLAVSTSTGPPLLVIIDEFDRLAPRLWEADQATLRAATTGGRKVNYIFVSHIDPARIVEEVPTVDSRLLGICEIVRLGILERQDVFEFFARVGSELNRPGFADYAATVWPTVGGHPHSVMVLAHELACDDQTGSFVLEASLARRRAELLRHAESLLRDLSPPTRAFLRGSSDDVCRSDALADGFFTQRGPVRPALVVEALQSSGLDFEAGSARLSEVELTVRLHDSIAEVNLNLKGRGINAWFESRDEVRRFSKTMRPCLDEARFEECVNHLAKVVYEAARMRDLTQGDPNAMEWRIPPEFRGVLTRSAGLSLNFAPVGA